MLPLLHSALFVLMLLLAQCPALFKAVCCGTAVAVRHFSLHSALLVLVRNLLPAQRLGLCVALCVGQQQRHATSFAQRAACAGARMLFPCTATSAVQSFVCWTAVAMRNLLLHSSLLVLGHISQVWFGPASKTELLFHHILVLLRKAALDK